MNFSPPRIFISYARTDGREFAEAFEKRLEQEAGIHAWRDLKSIEGGDIRPQVLRAIEEVQHFVLILTRRALESDWIKREWTHARIVGRRVSPVLADPSIRRSDLPAWIRRAEIYNIAEPERWTNLVQVLNGPGETLRVPYMAGHLPEGFIPRPEEYQQLKTAVLEAPSGRSVGLTTALQGAGGYGKTTLANALCRDEDIRFAFSDGILRVEIGKERTNVIGPIVDLIEMLRPDGKRPGFEDQNTAAEALAELIGDKRLLLVIDDVWRESQLRPFLLRGPNCVRLVTTRIAGALPRDAQAINVDEMRASEAFGLLTTGLSTDDDTAARAQLGKLAERLGHWAQMLEIANGWIKGRISEREPLAKALAEFESRLTKRGLVAFDPRDEVARNRAIRACVESSLEDLGASERAMLEHLAVLPEDEDVPVPIVALLWFQAAGLDEDNTEDLLRHFKARSLLQGLDLGARTLRLHDNLLWYLRHHLDTDGLRKAHVAMVEGQQAFCGGDWRALPASETYAWRHVLRHLRGAGRGTEVDALLTDYGWIKAKLAARGAQELMESWLPEPEDPDARLVGRAIALSTPALSRRPAELARQIFGRLGDQIDPRIAALVAEARRDPDFKPAPRWPWLTPPGPEQLRLTGHTDYVTCAAFSPDGALIVTASRDGTARVWDAKSGAETQVLRGHDTWIDSVSFSPDEAHIVTASWDRTARIWNSATGAEIFVLRGHGARVRSAAFSRDGTRVVTASADGTFRIWDAKRGTEIRAVSVGDVLTSATYSPDGTRILTTGYDCTARVWNAETGGELTVLRGHENRIYSSAFSSDGTRIVTASKDMSARIWETDSGTTTRILCGHSGSVDSAAFSPDDCRIITASRDCTARVWNAKTATEIAVLRGHDYRVMSASFAADGARIVTAGDKTARIWDLNAEAETGVRRSTVFAAFRPVFSPNGSRIITTCSDNAPRIWDARTGQQIAILRGHEASVQYAAFSPEGSRIITVSDDYTARIWNAEKGGEALVLGGCVPWLPSAFSHDGTRVITSSMDGTVQISDAANGTHITNLDTQSSVSSAIFSRDDNRIVTTSDGGAIQIWDVATGAVVVSIHGDEICRLGAAFSADGDRIVTWSANGIICIRDALTASEICVIYGEPLLRGDNLWDRKPAISPDGSIVVVAGYSDATARIWDADTGAEVAKLGGHNDKVNCATFLADGTKIVTASDDATARIWDAETGTEVDLVVFESSLLTLDVYGSAVAIGERLGRIHVLDAELTGMAEEGSNAR